MTEITTRDKLTLTYKQLVDEWIKRDAYNVLGVDLGKLPTIYKEFSVSVPVALVMDPINRDCLPYIINNLDGFTTTGLTWNKNRFETPLEQYVAMYTEGEKIEERILANIDCAFEVCPLTFTIAENFKLLLHGFPGKMICRANKHRFDEKLVKEFMEQADLPTDARNSG